MQLYNLELSPVNIAFITNVAIHRAWLRTRQITDPSSAPYLSGDTFRSLAPHIFDERTKTDLRTVKKGDVVFVSLSCLVDFFQTGHPTIPQPYILLTHNGDTNIDETYKKYIDKKILHWFSQNVLFSHPKVTPLPIGLENLDYYNHGVPAFFSADQKNSRKIPKILYGFSISTNPRKRQPIQDTLESLPIAEKIPHRLNAKAYLHHLSHYQFVASPPGNGADCMRTWEALYVGVIPIVERSLFATFFQKIGLPIFIVRDWRELQQLDEKKLATTYTKLMRQFNKNSLFLPYWERRIRAAKS